MSYRTSLVPARARLSHARLPTAHVKRKTLRARVVALVQTQQQQTAGKGLWDSFSAQFSGEWDGVIASFTADGEPMQLPEHYVPSAFREWNVELYDWQMQCSCIAEANKFKYTLRRLFPTVGCEADAVAFEEEAQVINGAGAALVPCLPDGSFSLGPASLPSDLARVKLEVALAGAVPGRRVRVMAVIQRHWSNRQWALQALDLVNESFERAYVGHVELPSCGTQQPPIAKLPRLTQQQLSGVWAPSGGLIYTPLGDTDWAVEEVDSTGTPQEDLGEGAVLLPCGAWARVLFNGDDVSFQAGVVQPDGRRALGSREYVAGQLACVRLLSQQRHG